MKRQRRTPFHCLSTTTISPPLHHQDHDQHRHQISQPNSNPPTSIKAGFLPPKLNPQYSFPPSLSLSLPYNHPLPLPPSFTSLIGFSLPLNFVFQLPQAATSISPNPHLCDRPYPQIAQHQQQPSPYLSPISANASFRLLHRSS